MNSANTILKRVTVFLLAILVSALLGCGDSSSIPEELRLRLEEGQQFLSERKYAVDQKVGNHTLDYKWFIIQKYEVNEGSKEGTYKLKVTWKRVQYQFPNNKSTSMIDSKNDSLSVDLTGLDGRKRIKSLVRTQLGLIGESYVVHIKPNRRVVRLEGFEQLGPSVIEKIRRAHSLSDQQAKFIKARFNSERKLSKLNRSTRMFQKAQLKSGAKWELEYEWHWKFPILVNQTYVYNGRSDSGIEFRAEGPVRVNSAQLPFKSEGWTIDYEAEGSQQQLIYIDSKTGMKTYAQKDGEFEGSKTTKAPEDVRETIKEMYPKTQDTSYRFNSEHHLYPIQSLPDQPPEFKKFNL